MKLSAVISPIRHWLVRIVRLQRARLKWSGINVRIAEGVVLNDVALSPYVNVAHDAEIARTSIGKRTSIGRYTKIQDAEIGAYCSISWDVTIGAIAHPMNHPSSHAFWYRKQFGLVDKSISLPHKTVRLGNDVWVGCDVVIMPGISVGNGAVIGANSVVTKDVEPYAIVAGSPARVLGHRFDKDIAERLDALNWWDWSDKRMIEILPLFACPLESTTMHQLEMRSR